ncbi:MAG TPA: aspartate/glutamate racemase family protein [Flavipsychrobacter sp.]|nr:aspartate/glutamate racemase family protein [Flavipsychrobacter sp.]
MKTLGLIGGMSWVSTIDYYKYINEGINAKLGGLNFAQCLIYSFNYQEIVSNGQSGNIEASQQRLEDIAAMLEADGADAIVLCANTAHMAAERLEKRLKIPVIHIGTVTATAVKKQGLNKVILLGTKFTMEKDFIKDKFREQEIDVLVPGEEDRIFIHHTIHEELGRGLVKPETKTRYLQIINDLVAQGGQGVILGCTEIPLLIDQSDLSIPAFDTMKIHADAAVGFVLQHS